jgi:hypothetical protein
MADTDPSPISGRAEFIGQALVLAQATRLDLTLLSYALDPTVYGSEPFVEAVKSYLLAEERARLRELINQPRVTAQGAHRLVELGRRLPSRIAFRELATENLADFRGEWIIADRRRILERSDAQSLVARHWDAAPLKARELLDRYEDLWNNGTPARELQHLSL